MALTPLAPLDLGGELLGARLDLGSALHATKCGVSVDKGRGPQETSNLESESKLKHQQFIERR